MEDGAWDIGAQGIEVDPGHLEAMLGFFHAVLSVSEAVLQGKKVFAKEYHFIQRGLAVFPRVNVVNLGYIVSSFARINKYVSYKYCDRRTLL